MRQQPSDHGLRSAYAKALKAHADAQARYDELRSDIQGLQAQLDTADAKERNAQFETAATYDHITAIKEHRRRRKLEIISIALNELASARQHTRAAVRDSSPELDSSVSELPSLLAQQSSETPAGSERIFELKKAVIKADIALKTTSSSQHESRDTGNAGDKIYALRRARDTLITSIEDELARLPETPHGLANENHNALPEPGQTDLQALYDRYIAARTRLVHSLSQPSSLDPRSHMSAPDSLPLTSKMVVPQSAELEILPHLAGLLAAYEAQQTSMYDSDYLRRQVASSTGRLRQAVRRLADESLLVTPGSAKVDAWAVAATEARRQTSELVGERLDRGEGHLEHVREMIKGLQKDDRVKFGFT